MEENFNSIGKRIQALREAQNLKRKDIAMLLGISEGNLHSMENDKTHPSAPALMKLAKYFKVTSDWILFGDQVNDDGQITNDVCFSVAVPDFEMAKHFSRIIEIWKNGDEKIKAWVLVQLEMEFSEAAKRILKDKK